MHSIKASVIIVTKRKILVILMKIRPLWFNIISIVTLTIATANLLTDATFLKILTMLCLAVVMGSYGTLELKKNRLLAFVFFGVATFLIFVLIKTVFVAVIK